MVNPASDLRIKVTPDKDVYQPGHRGTIQFEVTDQKGKAVPSALGVLIVDEAIYAMQEIQPGLEKVFFTLQQELVKPTAQVLAPANVPAMIGQPVVPPGQQQIAQALFTAVRPAAPKAWRVNPAQARREAIRGQIPTIAHAIYRYAATNADAVAVDKKTGKASFDADLLAKVVKAKLLDIKSLADGTGQDLTLDQLAEIDSGLTADLLARAITMSRLNTFKDLFIQTAAANRAAWLDGKDWAFTKDAIERTLKHTKTDALAAKDGWGRPFRLVRRPDKEANPSGSDVFARAKLISAGPDGKYETADDLQGQFANEWMLSMYWYGGNARQGMLMARGGAMESTMGHEGSEGPGQIRREVPRGSYAYGWRRAPRGEETPPRGGRRRGDSRQA